MTGRWQRAADVVWRDCHTQVVVLGAQAAAPRTLSGSAVAIWHLLAEPRALDDLCAELADLYAVDAEGITADVAAALDEMAVEGVVACTTS